MGEGLIKFEERINKRALRHFEGKPDVSFEEYHQFVNERMGTEFQEKYVREFYEQFLERRGTHPETN